MVQDAFLLALPSLVNYYSLESHFFIVYEKNITLQLLLKRNPKNIFSTKAKTLHIVQADQGRYVYSALRVQSLVSKTLLSWNEDLFRPHSNFEQSHVRQIKPENR